MGIDELRKKRTELQSRNNELDIESNALKTEFQRTIDVTANTSSIMEQLDREFEKKIGLDKTDIAVLFSAVILQSLRWIILPELKTTNIKNQDILVPKENRLNANEKRHESGIYDGLSSGAIYENEKISEYIENNKEKYASSEDEFYKKKNNYRSWAEIIKQPVPYDAMNALDKKFIPNIAGLNKQNANETYNNIYANNHHVATLGHDPVLGWVFGTLNILTNTISFVDFSSFSVKKGHKVKGLNEFQESNMLQYSDQIIDYSSPRLLYDIIVEAFLSIKEDPKRLPAAVAKHGMHMLSDKYCKEGLPIPFLSVIDPQKSQKLIEEGWNSIEFEYLLKADMKTIGISAVIDIMINIIVESIYMICYSGDEDINIRKAKIKKIIASASVITSSSNLLYVSVTGNISKLDVGGIGATLVTLFTNTAFVSKIKQEYLNNEYRKVLMGE